MKAPETPKKKLFDKRKSKEVLKEKVTSHLKHDIKDSKKGQEEDKGLIGFLKRFKKDK